MWGAEIDERGNSQFYLPMLKCTLKILNRNFLKEIIYHTSQSLYCEETNTNSEAVHKITNYYFSRHQIQKQQKGEVSATGWRRPR